MTQSLSCEAPRYKEFKTIEPYTSARIFYLPKYVILIHYSHLFFTYGKSQYQAGSPLYSVAQILGHGESRAHLEFFTLLSMSLFSLLPPSLPPFPFNPNQWSEQNDDTAHNEKRSHRPYGTNQWLNDAYSHRP